MAWEIDELRKYADTFDVKIYLTSSDDVPQNFGEVVKTKQGLLANVGYYNTGSPAIVVARKEKSLNLLLNEIKISKLGCEI